LTDCPFENGYDLTIGTSERGMSIDRILSPEDHSVVQRFPEFRHALIVFGGLHGIEACVDGDDSLTAVGTENAHELFDVWVNTCPNQGSRTIRSEVRKII
jgi:hypothetical protein